ncbi:uncharacterized protein LOC124366824 [Homalodisca vitripennis]|uniref:uncharacterized protein LOC124366824 n=1 Tax=Homalodisca vitripennis TaxID=197043 RepID=UPI001EE9F8C1|nr:uncharacterized protein LOC124366824 [Homalodisca vitripennis]
MPVMNRLLECGHRSNVKTAGVNPGDRGDPINRPPSSWITGLRPEARKIELWMGAKSTSLSAGGAASFCRIRALLHWSRSAQSEILSNGPVETYDYILSHIKGDLQKWSNFRTCIEPAEKLSILLRYLSTGMSFEALSETFRMSNYTVGKIVEEVCDCMWEQLAPVHLPVPNKQRFLEIAAEFKEKWNFPNCVGCIDGKHVRIKSPGKSGTMFLNYKKFFSVNLHAVADAKCKFIFIDVGAYGKQSDGGVFEASPISKFFENFSEHLPAPSPIDTSSETLIPYVLVGDDAYPLKSYIMKPFANEI